METYDEDEIDELIDLKILRRKIDETIDSLPVSERDKDIFRRRYGLCEDGKVWTLRELGERYGISDSRVSQIQQRILRKLRYPCFSRELKKIHKNL